MIYYPYFVHYPFYTLKFQVYSEEVVIAVATAIAVLDVFFIMVAVPESLPDKCKPARSLTLEQVKARQYNQTHKI
jgi:hypothetical protein